MIGPAAHPWLRPLLVVALLAWSAPALAACPAPVSALTVAQDISLSDAAFADMDSEAFNASRSSALRTLPCVNETITTTQVSALHRMQGLAGFLNRDQAASIASFRSLLAVSPGYVLSETVAPEGHPLRAWFETAMMTPSAAPRPVTAPKKGWVYVDGKIATVAPSDRPFVLQVFDPNGAIILTELVGAGAPIPTPTGDTKVVAKSSNASSAAPLPGGRPPDRGGERRVNAPLLATAGVMALASGGLYWAASTQADQFWDPATASNQLDGLRQQTNTLAGLSLGVGALALGAGSASFFVGTW